jgi:hypothetical protein
MGGTYPVGPPKDPNLYGDIPASQELLEKWPTPIMFSCIEIGKDLMTGDGLADYWHSSEPGTVAISNDGATRWTAAPNGTRHYLIEKMSRKELAAIIEELMEAPAATRGAAPASGR